MVGGISRAVIRRVVRRIRRLILTRLLGGFRSWVTPVRWLRSFGGWVTR